MHVIGWQMWMRWQRWKMVSWHFYWPFWSGWKYLLISVLQQNTPQLSSQILDSPPLVKRFIFSECLLLKPSMFLEYKILHVILIHVCGCNNLWYPSKIILRVLKSRDFLFLLVVNVCHWRSMSTNIYQRLETDIPVASWPHVFIEIIWGGSIAVLWGIARSSLGSL